MIEALALLLFFLFCARPAADKAALSCMQAESAVASAQNTSRSLGILAPVVHSLSLRDLALRENFNALMDSSRTASARSQLPSARQVPPISSRSCGHLTHQLPEHTSATSDRPSGSVSNRLPGNVAGTSATTIGAASRPLSTRDGVECAADMQFHTSDSQRLQPSRGETSAAHAQGPASHIQAATEACVSSGADGTGAQFANPYDPATALDRAPITPPVGGSQVAAAHDLAQSSVHTLAATGSGRPHAPDRPASPASANDCSRPSSAGTSIASRPAAAADNTGRPSSAGALTKVGLAGEGGREAEAYGSRTSSLTSSQVSSSNISSCHTSNSSSRCTTPTSISPVKAVPTFTRVRLATVQLQSDYAVVRLFGMLQQGCMVLTFACEYW